MRLQRWDVDVDGRVRRDNEADWVKSEDVEALEAQIGMVSKATSHLRWLRDALFLPGHLLEVSATHEGIVGAKAVQVRLERIIKILAPDDDKR